VEFAKIVALSILAAICYGIAHDQVTARICVEYFTVFHPPVFPTDNPTLLGLGWGVIATWWVGTILGILLGIAARAGRAPKVGARSLLRPIVVLLAVMAISALGAGLTGYVLARHGSIGPPWWVRAHLAPASYAAFMGDWWAHNASYAAAGAGGIILCVMTWRKRSGLRKLKTI
jgi:hypothetical protein